MKAVARLHPAVACGGMTLYVAFVLSTSARAAEVGGGGPLVPPPAPAADMGGHPLGLGHPLSVGQPLSAGWPIPETGPLPPPPGSPTPYGPLPPPAPPFCDTAYGVQTDPGAPGSPGFGHPHYPAYQTRYGIWYQPRSFHEPTRAVYRPSPFRPRGLGNLLYDPCRRDRMDYARPVVADLPSRYGPAYYPNYTEKSECLVRPERKYVPPIWGSAE